MLRVFFQRLLEILNLPHNTLLKFPQVLLNLAIMFAYLALQHALITRCYIPPVVVQELIQ